ncbi:serine protease [Lentzea sp. NBRC 105346]|uniref:S1 family peptidase n=1 Tax=Lentzea sp. NBRC 105346 TaxID=3032205 RepID=UPI0024A02341|nr:serine protease [Lentzea sp. NBRC 105346]GLZ31243.1 serine protease [Lentzea sp. NBRC 105346]
MRRLAVALVLLLLLPGQALADAQIVGGKRAPIKDTPWVVYLTDKTGFQYCGGTLVAPDKVLTAAHCAAGKSASSVRVVAGREDKQDKDSGYAVTPDEVWVHPDYSAADQGADVAVFTLKEPLPYEPLKIATSKELYAVGTQLTALGWGRTSEQGNPSRYLMAASVPVLPEKSCREAYPQFVAAAMFCAGLPDGGVDTCQGDSGGPIVANGTLVGITSWGEGCARRGKPGVYVRVAAYADDLHAVLVPSPVRAGGR